MKKSPLPVQNAAATEKKLRAKEDLVKLLQQYFGHSEFRGKQLQAIEAVLSGRDCFCLMPTGGGKSMCYQIPALANTGVVLVVCPLIALMENQVMALKEKGIAVEYLSSTQQPHVRGKIYEDLDSGKPSLKLLYVTPELIATAGFMSKLTKLYNRGLLNLIAIDEAHCISTWGHDFRPSYRKLSSLRNHLPGVPMLALTATAVPTVQRDVIESLHLQHPLILRSSFDRPNIFYEVRYKDLLEDTYDDLSKQLKTSGNACSIVYCLERTTCDDLSAHLLKNGISSAAYHAGLNSKMRSTVLDDWLSSRIQVVVATVAFGALVAGLLIGAPLLHAWLLRDNGVFFRMGIDRKDVRLVCHFNIPKSMEAFYQESGRAGRDQMPSRSLLYYGIDDRKRMEFILSNAKNKKVQTSGSHDGLLKKSLEDFKQMVEYCEGSGCRRKKILDSFGEQVSASLCRKSCDACKHPSLVAKYLEELSCASSIHQKFASSYVFMTSSSDKVAEDQFTEFWNRGDEASASEEDISDSDEGQEIEKNLARSRFSSASGINEKIEFLQRAEESYCRKEAPSKKSSNLDNKAVSEALRQACKQRLLNALKLAEQRLGNLQIELEASANFLESECYKKYGKVGKTFYNSQVASTVRWLSNSTSQEITDRLGSNSNLDSRACNSDYLATESSLPLADSKDQVQGPVEAIAEKSHGNVASETSLNAAQMKTSSSQDIELPPILSFSEFANRKPTNLPSKSTKHACTKVNRDREEKRMKLH